MAGTPPDGGIGQRQTRGAETLVAEVAEMAPAAELEFAVEAGIALLRVPEKLRFAKHKRRIVDAEVQAIAIAQLRIVGARTRGIAVEDRAEQR